MSLGKTYYIVLSLIIVVVGIVMTSCVRPRNIDWTGKYVAEFTTYLSDNSGAYESFKPTVEIVDSGENYIITISMKTEKGLKYGIGDVTISAQATKPTEVEKTQSNTISFVAEDLHSGVDGLVFITYVELKYDTEKTICFRYSDSEDTLMDQEFYTLTRVEG